MTTHTINELADKDVAYFDNELRTNFPASFLGLVIAGGVITLHFNTTPSQADKDQADTIYTAVSPTDIIPEDPFKDIHICDAYRFNLSDITANLTIDKVRKHYMCTPSDANMIITFDDPDNFCELDKECTGEIIITNCSGTHSIAVDNYSSNNYDDEAVSQHTLLAGKTGRYAVTRSANSKRVRKVV